MSGKALEDITAAKLPGSITVQGIAVEGVTPDTLNDFEFLEAVAVLIDEAEGDAAKLRATASIAPAIFGKTQWRRIKGELREQNDGRLTAETVMRFIDGVLTELKAKNS